MSASDYIDAPPVDLDPPSAALTHWQSISGNDTAVIHDGDASKVISYPRPIWSDPDEDYVATSGDRSRYASERASVAARASMGSRTDEVFEPAEMAVQLIAYGDGTRYINLAQRRVYDKTWREMWLLLSADEALEVAEVLRAAVALLTDEGGAR